MIEEKFERDIWYVLCKIKQLLRYTKTTAITHEDYISVIPPDHSKISPRAEHLVLHRLDALRVIKIQPYKSIEDDWWPLESTGPASATRRQKWAIPDFVSFEVVQKQFDRIYKKYKKKNFDQKGTGITATKTGNGKPTIDYYIVKDGEDFRYNGALLDKIGKATGYYEVFDALYTLLPQGGFETYSNIGAEVKSRIPKARDYSTQKMAKFIQDNLSEHNGFLHHAKKIKNTLVGGKQLIHVVRGKGVDFNNRKGG